MNRFCRKECGELRAEGCPMPGRAELMVRNFGEVLMGATTLQIGAAATPDYAPLFGETELRIPEVTVCIEMHKVTRATQQL